MAKKTAAAALTPAAVPTPPTASADEVLIHVDPETVLADDNIRFNLKATSLDQLKASILAEGGVLEPVEAEPLTDTNGHTLRLTSGFYRHAAVLALNKEGAGLTLPVIVRQTPDPAARLKRQLAENKDRENLSPMDRAVAIKRLLDAGVPRIEIRQLFARPVGKKGDEMKPMSNAMLNILVNLLALPKGIQQKVHDGILGIEAAYLLGKVAPEKRQAVIDRAEADRAAFLEMEEKDEERLLQAEKKVEEIVAKEQVAVSEAEQGAQAVKDAEALVKEKEAEFRAIQKEPYLELDDEGKKALMERMKAAEAAFKSAQKLSREAKNNLAKAIKTKETVVDLAKKSRLRLEEAQRLAKKKKAEKEAGTGTAPITASQVKKASVKETASGTVPLGISDIRQVIKDLTKDGTPTRVCQIGLVLAKCFNGVTTTKQLIEDLAVITGERKLPATK